jgi:tetratricopeptide (TPR) repeat protein
MRGWLAMLFLACVGVWAQNSSAPGSSSPSSQNPTAPPSAAPPSAASKPAPPNLEPPRSDKVDASALDNEPGESSSKDNPPVDLTQPGDDTKSRSPNPDILTDTETDSTSDVKEFHSWDPHKAAKNVEVGDYYFKRKNYHAAESRYREALLYKNNDASATFHLAECLEKTDRPEEALLGYESYLKILPHGPEAEKAQKAVERLKPPSAEAKPQK